MPNVDATKAEEMLRRAVATAKSSTYAPKSRNSRKIQSIIEGTHLTYRYILFTGLLAKSTNRDIDPIALQAGAPLKGAYDARSLCHHVVVPLERILLQGGLGASNEPFLNKPARFTHLSIQNAVRRGKDRKTLEDAIYILSSVSSSKEAFLSLTDAAYFALKRRVSAPLNPTDANFTHARIVDFGAKFLEKSIEGQAAAVFLGTLLSCAHKLYQKSGMVLVHPVNQSGASSRETCDIDIKLNGQIIQGYEVKDKSFTRHDVQHAARKAREAGLSTLVVVIGPNGRFNASHQDAVAMAQSLGVSVLFIDLSQAVSMLLGQLHSISASDFLEEMRSICKKARVKDEIYNQMSVAAKNSGLAV